MPLAARNESPGAGTKFLLNARIALAGARYGTHGRDDGGYEITERRIDSLSPRTHHDSRSRAHGSQQLRLLSIDENRVRNALATVTLTVDQIVMSVTDRHSDFRSAI